MGFSEAKFLSLPPQARAKKLADLLRVFVLRLGEDWKHAQAEYDRLVAWHLPTSLEFSIGVNSQHARVLDLYHHWRDQAGLGPERDMYLQQDEKDRSQANTNPLPWTLLAHNLRSAYNVGSLIRTADCFGLESVNLSGYSPEISHVALRSAARGAEQWIPVHRWESPLECIQHFKSQDYAILALETGTDSIPLPKFRWPEKGLIVLGNEELGIAPELLEACSYKVEIPMRGRKASLNVASAFAVASAFLDQERRSGNALALALIVLVIATLLASAIMTGNTDLSGHATRNINRMQAQYLAESAIRLKGSLFPWIVADSVLTTGPSLEGIPILPEVTLDSSGIWIQMHAKASFRDAERQVYAMFGVPLSREAFAPAIRLSAQKSPIDLASMKVDGSIITDNQGGAMAASKILEWTSRLTQRLWTARRNQMGIAFHPDSIENCGDLCVRGTQSYSRFRDFPETLELRIREGDLRIDLGFTGDPTVLPGKRTFLVQGAVLIRGSIQFDTLEILASGPVTLEGDIRANHIEIASEGRLYLSGEQHFEAVLLAQGDIEIQGKSHITGRSWISALRQAPDPEAGIGNVDLRDGAQVQGWVSALTSGQAILKIDSRSRISGIALASNAIQNEGEIYGVAISNRLACEGKANENCGGSGEFVRDSLPTSTLQPPSFELGQPRKLLAFQWRVQ